MNLRKSIEYVGKLNCKTSKEHLRQDFELLVSLNNFIKKLISDSKVKLINSEVNMKNNPVTVLIFLNTVA